MSEPAPKRKGRPPRFTQQEQGLIQADYLKHDMTWHTLSMKWGCSKSTLSSVIGPVVDRGRKLRTTEEINLMVKRSDQREYTQRLRNENGKLRRQVRAAEAVTRDTAVKYNSALMKIHWYETRYGPVDQV